MPQPAHQLRRIFWVVFACLLLVPAFAAAAERPLPVDLDGDGRHDHFTVDRHRDPAVLRVWLSASNSTHLIRTRAALVQVVAVDLDGDHRPELVARDSESRIRVWTRKGKRFHSYRPRDVASRTLQPPSHRTIRDNDSELPDLTASSGFAPFALALCPSPRAPAVGPSSACAPHTAPAYRSLTVVDPFAARPPPSFIPS
jgi:hypothetical protein